MRWIRYKKFTLTTNAGGRVIRMRDEILHRMELRKVDPIIVESFKDIAPEDSAGYIRFYFLHPEFHWIDEVFDLADMIRYGPINRTFPRPSAIQYVVW